MTTIRARVFAVATALVIVLCGSLALIASRRNSVTFDEPFLVASGARGVATGDFSLSFEHPPGMLTLYGYAATLAGVRLPPDTTVWNYSNSFNYAQELFFRSGNNPERIAFASRMVAVLISVILGISVAFFAWRRAGPVAALFSASIVMLLPDVMAHAGIAYNDLPGALMFLLGLWAWDNAMRNPTPARAAVAGAVTGVALGVKFTALALGPAAIALFVVEAATRGRDGSWYRRVALRLPIALAAIWLVLALIYRGDFTLALFRTQIARNLWHIGIGSGVSTLLLGRISESGFWYYFPVGLVLKTPAALHLLVLVAAFGYSAAWRIKGAPMRNRMRSSLRMLPIGLLVYLALLMRSNLNIGMRHALPLLPLLALLTGIGLSAVWDSGARRMRLVIAVLLLAFAASTLSYYPWFLSYLSEYVPDRREAGHRVMVDSNLDWGQGLLELRDFMREERINGVYLSYFGSALPEGYGVRYIAMKSFLPLPVQPPLATEPRWVVISATNLEGLSIPGDSFRRFRQLKPDRVLANSIYAYRVR